jgi:murein DD-endopeptidase MepM/ murein hydrolase activator NlpD
MLAARQFALQFSRARHPGKPGQSPCELGMRPRSKQIRVLLAATATLLAVGLGASASGQDLQSQLSHKRERLDRVNHREGTLSTTIQHYGDQIDQLIGEISVLRNREAIVEQQLRKKQAELHRDKVKLNQLRANLQRSLNVLRNRLVDIYRSGEPDLLTVVLDSSGFDDLVNRYEYLKRIEQQDSDVVDRVRDLRNETIDTVNRVAAERDDIAAHKAELERTSNELESRQSELDTARDRRKQALLAAQDTEDRLEGDISKIQDRIAAQVAAAQQAAGLPAAPAGPFRGESSEGFIWPVNGPVVSPFGPRTINGGYENHPGIDISVPSGTPIHAAANGVVLFTQPEASSGGYGNYTCIDHGSGISTCYAHQSSFSVSQGQEVHQGDVIGISDCTGYCFGPHLHFEVRINGQVTDPMAYLP